MTRASMHQFSAKVACIAIGTLLVGTAFAKPDTDRVPATNNRSGVSVTIPQHAVEVAPDIFSLGTAMHEGKVVEGIMIVDRRAAAKPSNPGGGNGGGGSTCFAFLASGAKWKAAEPWIMNTANAHALSGSFLFGNQSANLGKWESAAGTEIFGGGSVTTSTLVADEAAPDGVNEVYFGSIDSPGAIAVTIVWGVFSGPPKQRHLVEWDQVYDQVDFAWSDSGAAGKMDFENIATHEDGHAAGMGHPSDSCTEETMYRFAQEGETKKRDLNGGDIAGIGSLY